MARRTGSLYRSAVVAVVVIAVCLGTTAATSPTWDGIPSGGTAAVGANWSTHYWKSCA